MTPQQLKSKILSDMRVELSDMFNRNFSDRSFFGAKWAPRKTGRGRGGRPLRGTLMIVTGRLRRSVQGRIEGNGVVFSSDTPYASIHNEGFNGTQQVRSYVARSRKSGRSYTVPAHSRHMVMPQRQFIGGHRRVTQAVEAIVRTNLYDYFDQLAKKIQK